MKKLGLIGRPPNGLTKIANLNTMHYYNSYCDAMTKLSTLQTEGKEREASEYIQSKDFTCVGAEIGGGFKKTKDIYEMKYKEAMAIDNKEDWGAVLEEEHNNLEKYDV